MSINKVIVALDQMNQEEIDQFLPLLNNSVPTVKIGLELFLRYGPDLVHQIFNNYKKNIFLDLKLHDIPITVERAIHSLKGLPLRFLTVHLSGGEAMLKAAIREAKKGLPGCQILGVSFLTSLESNDLKNLFGITNTDDAFLKLFDLANLTGIEGVVCSPNELDLLKNKYPHILAITPGIRFDDEIISQKTQDQKRIASPKTAFEKGADYIVMGRSLTQSKNMAARLKELD